ncbi:MAG TPA: ribosome-associated translation inhibitor RaiA [Phycisphaerae bacterium]|nr:ribosome-associated translation inhibitor RaiA [Phycisphaerae bacterium]
MLRIRVSGRRTELDEALKTYASEKADRLQRYYDRLQSVEIMFDVEAEHHRCEVIAKADHHTTFVAREEHADAYASLDAAVRDLERQLKRHKEKFRNRKHLTGREDLGRLSEPPRGEVSDETQTEGEAS